MPKVSQIKLLKPAASRDEAVAQLRGAGDTIIVERGSPRFVLMRCPCGCGDNLTMNLDRRTGPAWRIYQKRDRLTIFPSYWREDGCQSHFILWSNHIYWCSGWDDDDRVWRESSELEGKVLQALSVESFRSYEQVAEDLGEIPWEVLRACYNLVRHRKAVANPLPRRGEFRRL